LTYTVTCKQAHVLSSKFCLAVFSALFHKRITECWSSVNKLDALSPDNVFVWTVECAETFKQSAGVWHGNE